MTSYNRKKKLIIEKINKKNSFAFKKRTGTSHLNKSGDDGNNSGTSTHDYYCYW